MTKSKLDKTMSTSAHAARPFRFSIAPGICSATEEDGTAILNIERGKFYSLIGPGSELWARLAASPQGLTLDDIIAAPPEDFGEMSSEEIKREIEGFLDQLNQKGIIRTSDSEPERLIETARASVNTAFVFLAHPIVHLLLKLKLNKVAAFFHLTLVDIMLTIGGFRELYHTVQRWPVMNNRKGRLESINEICTAVDRACVYYPKAALCLQRSVVATCLLRQLGISAEMVIGCHKLPFSSHAWVEVEGIVVNDHENVQKYYKILERI